MKNWHDAFIDADLALDGIDGGALSGRSFAVKDLFHVKGQVTGFGHPLWRERHQAEAAHAPVVQKLLAAGASVRGKTHTDEFAFSLNGENAHYGTPENPNAPGRIPGGSSSGSAAAVAGECVDFALGTDTGGSVRVPASYCGIFGLRPTHDRIALEGVLPLAPSFDTIGWFARDPSLMQQVGQFLFDDWNDRAPGIVKLWLPEDVWSLADAETREALAPAVMRLAAMTGGADETDLARSGSLEDWFMPFRICQGYEIWHCHGDWITNNKPKFGPGVSDRFNWVATITREERDKAMEIRARITAELAARLPEGVVMAIPTAPGIAPLRGQSAEQLENFRYRALQLTGISVLTGVPQMNLPLGRVAGCPVGLSIIAARGCDETLLDIASEISGMASSGLAPLLEA
ncbi:amidase [Aestuariispira insulae]|uniref:Amidase n=1 Tax=Aestuariispira insulae TaxID=1461337 RepID=A0A3D9HI62_9PROT|nr:amidase [Aestuariispira insulae]RED49170.1 amidase [Aestuariispira insulae]